MNILRIVYEWPPPWDGLAPAPYEVTAAQARLGHKIDVICARWPFSGPIEKLNNVTLHPLIREPLKGTLLVTVAPFVLLYYFYYRAKNKPDVIHAHGHFGAYYYFYRRFLARYFPKAKELSIPLVAHFHNTVKGRWVKLVEDKANISPISEKLDWPLAERSDKAAIETADAYVFVSEDVKKEAIKYYGANPNKCHVVETGVNTELFVPIGPEEKAKTRAELGLDP